MKAMGYPGKNLVDGILSDCHIPDICYKQWCQEVNKYLGLADSTYWSGMGWFQRALKQNLIDTTQRLIDDFKALDPDSCAYLTQNLVPVMRNLGTVRQHADAELRGRLSAFEAIVQEAYEKHTGASTDKVVLGYELVSRPQRIH